MTLICKLPTEPDRTRQHKRRYGLFKCDFCGAEVKRLYQNGIENKSCGCATFLKSNWKHNCSHSRLYQIWSDMKNRCKNVLNKRYHRYGGRGIFVFDEWNDFSIFKSWAENNGYNDSLTIDRIDNDKSYTPDNCRWVTIQENIKNRSKTNYVRKPMPKKLVMEQVIEIRQGFTGERGYMARMAKKFNITKANVSAIINNKIWVGI